MAGLRFRAYLNDAALAGFTAEQAEAALAEVRAERGVFGPNPYQEAIARMSRRRLAERRRGDARRLLDDLGELSPTDDLVEGVAGLLADRGLVVDLVSWPDGGALSDPAVRRRVDRRWDREPGLDGSDREGTLRVIAAYLDELAVIGILAPPADH